MRLSVNISRFDALRLDHFIGFARFWAIPADAESPKDGVWREGPGEAFFSAMEEEFGALPLIAEDLGAVGDDVHALRDRFGLASMRVLQFAFDGSPDNPHLPHNIPENAVVYTGTHDNDTALRAGSTAQTGFSTTKRPPVSPSRAPWRSGPSGANRKTFTGP